MEERKKHGFFKKMLANMCHTCPVCSYARAKPESLIGRILHHPWHADHCPFWKSEKDYYGEEKPA